MSSHLPPGTVLQNRYRILSLLGEGSFSTVYLATDSQWKGNLVALKEISTAGYSQEEYMQLNVHFLREAAFLMNLKHPGLPRVVEFFGENSCYYLALEWIGGKDLEKVLVERQRLGADEVVGWGVELCDVLNYLHSREPYPVLIGDLKPSNVILRFDGHVSIIDFGVARQLAPESQGKIYMVSPGFSPPEQYRTKGTDERSDIYALGATLYWLLCGQDLSKFKFNVPPLSTFRPEIERELEDFLNRCLSQDPARRPASARAVAHELSNLQQQMSRDEGDFTASDILSALYRGKKEE